jgi:outer membrane scaffolding protein for murein synthesis (MipA/OmpV family)
LNVKWRFLFVALMLWSCAPRLALSQTPSPLQEWQYSSGVILERFFEPEVPKWEVALGVATEYQPLYDGASDYRLQGGPVINVRYRDIAFITVGEGIGWNFIRGNNYRVGVALGYDLGRKESADLDHLRGLGDIGRAPIFKIFGSYVISKEFPLVLRADIRRIVGGADGVLGDLEAYLPLPGSSKKLAMFAGPSVMFANRVHMQNVFGISADQATASGYPQYDAHGGANAVGFGFSATRFLTDHWLINLDAAANRLLGSAANSPITQKKQQRVLALSFAYYW